MVKKSTRFPVFFEFPPPRPLWGRSNSAFPLLLGPPWGQENHFLTPLPEHFPDIKSLYMECEKSAPNARPNHRPEAALGPWAGRTVARWARFPPHFPYISLKITLICLPWVWGGLGAGTQGPAVQTPFLDTFKTLKIPLFLYGKVRISCTFGAFSPKKRHF